MGILCYTRNLGITIKKTTQIGVVSRPSSQLVTLSLAKDEQNCQTQNLYNKVLNAPCKYNTVVKGKNRMVVINRLFTLLITWFTATAQHHRRVLGSLSLAWEKIKNSKWFLKNMYHFCTMV